MARIPPPKPPDLAKRAAKSAGQIKFLGSKCNHGHSGLRYTSTGQCVDCIPFYRSLKRRKENAS